MLRRMVAPRQCRCPWVEGLRCISATCRYLCIRLRRALPSVKSDNLSSG